jgi:hypothetical protein
MQGGFLGVTRTLVQSGSSYQVRVWGEGRLALPVVGSGGVGPLRLIPGAAAGVAFQIAPLGAEQFYVQISPGLDAYWMQIGDPAYTSFSQDAQVRPILLRRVGATYAGWFSLFCAIRLLSYAGDDLSDDYQRRELFQDLEKDFALPKNAYLWVCAGWGRVFW